MMILNGEDSKNIGVCCGISLIKMFHTILMIKMKLMNTKFDKM